MSAHTLPPEPLATRIAGTEENPPRLLTTAELRAAGRTPPYPFRLRLEGGGELIFLRSLRVLPGKRVVGEGVHDGERVLIKLFIAQASQRHWQREHDGIRALHDAGLPTPPLLAAGRLARDGHYLVTRFLDNARTLDTDEETLRHWLLPATRLVGRLHAGGLLQTDLHLRNFLRQGEQLFLIDGDGIQDGKDVGAARDNLALFLAQLPIGEEGRHGELIDAYRQVNPACALDTDALAVAVRNVRARRLRLYLRKCVRDCTQFKVEKSLTRFSAVVREEAERLAPILADPDAWMAKGTPLKTGNTSTVVRVELDGRLLAIKRYNIKNLGHAASRFWRPSRAWHSWCEGHRLHMLGIPAALPLALVEKRLGPLRGKAWLIMDHVQGPNLLQHWRANSAPEEAELRALQRTFRGLASARVSHGDLKASNLIWHQNEVALIDLDAMRQHASEAGFESAWRRDIQRFLENWPTNSVLRSSLACQPALSPRELGDSSKC